MFDQLYRQYQQSLEAGEGDLQLLNRLRDLARDGSLDQRMKVAMSYGQAGQTETYVSLIKELSTDGFPPALHLEGWMALSEGQRQRGYDLLEEAIRKQFWPAAMTKHEFRSKFAKTVFGRIAHHLLAKRYAIKAAVAEQLVVRSNGQIKSMNYKG